jgi:hypothetical protein
MARGQIQVALVFVQDEARLVLALLILLCAGLDPRHIAFLVLLFAAVSFQISEETALRRILEISPVFDFLALLVKAVSVLNALKLVKLLLLIGHARPRL